MVALGEAKGFRNPRREKPPLSRTDSPEALRCAQGNRRLSASWLKPRLGHCESA